jgi:threonine dehydratase
LKRQLQGKTTAVILSGGNVDLQTLHQVIKPDPLSQHESPPNA